MTIATDFESATSMEVLRQMYPILKLGKVIDQKVT